MLDDAIEAGELLPCDTVRLAVAVAAMMNGSLLQWAIDRDGTIRDRMQTDLDTLLRPRLARSTAKRSRPRGKRSRA